MDSTKIFIDTDNEITFVIEKILAARTEKVILVIPDRASLLSSITGLKLINRVLDKSDKLLVLVTLDEIGAQLSRKAGLSVVSRVGEINEEIWEKVSKAKFEAIKKDARPHYMPEVLDKEIESPEDDPTKQPEKIDLKSFLIDEGSKEDAIENLDDIVPVEDAAIDLKKHAVPEIRINVDNTDLEEEPETVKQSEDKSPTFLSKDEDVKEAKSEKVNLKDMVMEESNNIENVEESLVTRVRKKAPSSSGIKNLSFTVGKDISQKKK